MKKLFVLLTTIMLMISLQTTTLAASKKSSTLTNKEALHIALDAREHFWSAMSGYKINEHSDYKLKSFTYKDMTYNYLSKTFDTKKKLNSYLSQVFTKDAITHGLKDYQFIVHKGKMAVPVGDGDNMLNWEKASPKLVSKKNTIYTYEFTVPTLDGRKVKRTVTYEKVQKNWKVTKIDAVI
ncbi:IseA DL-endopeptidase inhibitor family protein [Bacillus sp. FJAT-53060]|uniref:IseA DL-endopeptidase inhibitor family protein n=1 Tax=Bacillus TaxID=1386 RepID=UPI001CFA0421|nr:IseA DL-endopeptidase inhibitor family protein [Bacillus stratosphericus]